MGREQYLQAAATATDASSLIQRQWQAESKDEGQRVLFQIEEEKQRVEQLKTELAKARTEADNANATTDVSKPEPEGDKADSGSEPKPKAMPVLKAELQPSPEPNNTYA